MPGHQCKSQLLLLEGEEEMEEIPVAATEIEEEDNGEISLYALRGLANSKIFKVKGRFTIIN